jgi:hypothetical protein
MIAREILWPLQAIFAAFFASKALFGAYVALRYASCRACLIWIKALRAEAPRLSAKRAGSAHGVRQLPAVQVAEVAEVIGVMLGANLRAMCPLCVLS